MPLLPRAVLPPPSVPPVAADVPEEVVPVAVVPVVVPTVVLLVVPVDVPPVVVLGTFAGNEGTPLVAVGTCPGSAGTAGTVTPPAVDPVVEEPTGGVTTVVTLDDRSGSTVTAPLPPPEVPCVVFPRSVPPPLFVPAAPDAWPVAVVLVAPVPPGAATRAPGVFSGSTQLTLRSEQKAGIEVRSLLASAAYAAGAASTAAIARVNVRSLVMAVTSAVFRCKSRA